MSAKYLTEDEIRMLRLAIKEHREDWLAEDDLVPVAPETLYALIHEVEASRRRRTNAINAEARP